ncbi:hypothetical protein HKCCE4037_03135 [Rhodobacterales bacterium HKCCE4037]|nr:hypothetical protein [Rhodobacterales bacterium HKCCE4037]
MTSQASHARPRLAILATLLATTLPLPALADFVGVSACATGGASSTPALHFVDGGNRFVVAVGSGGLTRNIVFNEAAAIEWARNSGLFPDGTVFGNYDDHVCGLLNEADDPAPEPDPAPAPPPEVPEEPHQGCQGGECEAQ